MMIRIKRNVRLAGILLLAGQTLPCFGQSTKFPGSLFQPKAPKMSPAAPKAAVEDHSKKEHGIASVYTDRRTASGEKFSAKALTAAHRTLPFGSLVRVTAPRTGRSVIVRINDRGPFKKGRVIDLSQAAADGIGLTKKMGITKVEIIPLR